MNVEVLIYVYLAVCLAMILFNIATIIAARRRERVSKRRNDRYRRLIAAGLERIRQGDALEWKHIAYLRRKLRYAGHMLAFVRVVMQQYAKTPAEIRLYLGRLSEILSSLIPHYERQNDPIRYAFFLYTMKELCAVSGVTPPRVASMLIRALRVPYIYCRENALQAIYSSGQPDLVLRALRLIDGEKIAHHKKLLSSGLIKYRGGAEELLNSLWAAFEAFDAPMQEVILEYTLFHGPSHRERVFALLTDESKSEEVRFACIRYFAKFPDPEAHQVLLHLAKDTENPMWGYAANACTALASYPHENTVAALKGALSVPTWQVRYNAAESLARLGVSYMDLIDVLDGNDRYAREILQYQLDMQYNQRREGALA